ncbi:accessory gene regulator ArgB-like protein [Desulforamulus aeronauticus]|uniref:Accessory gene regulator B n=1 Tax=Desulforamulus aeronauticus DSM 10349 TaxID=1121421 RepID=A0A1M6SHA2_9FIRM|nr:accessory gene regulator B family protein [Desulforamulus aeronauticus]SHK44095.1 accessory gene regulator B [Desulforamulus aeronauticus DSM 10349]
MNKLYENKIDSWAGTLAQQRQGNQEDNKAIMAYALRVVIFNLIVTLTTFGIGALFGVFSTTAVALIASGSLRIFTGGYHCANPLTCLALTVGLFTLCGKVAVQASAVMDFSQIVIFLSITMSLALLFIAKNAPVDIPNKPVKLERRPRLKKMGINVWILWVIILGILMTISFNSYKEIIVAIGLGLANQTFSISGILKNQR